MRNVEFTAKTQPTFADLLDAHATAVAAQCEATKALVLGRDTTTADRAALAAESAFLQLLGGLPCA